MVKVSILVAVYNAAAYLRQCLDSLCRQTLTDLEIICIDDASTDSSPQILREYQQCDPRLRLITLSENSGQARARNEGLAVARGEYVCFLDSDDWFSADALERMVERFETDAEVDCVLFKVVNHYSPTHETAYPMTAFDTLSGEAAFEQSLTWAIHGVYGARRVLHQRYPYDTTHRAYSDDNTTRLHYLAARKVAYCQGTYYYRQHTASVTHAISVRRFDHLLANRDMKTYLQRLGVAERLLNRYEVVRWLNVVDLYFFYFQHRHQLLPADRQRGLQIIRTCWASIEVDRLPRKLKRKLGYAPFRGMWWAFRLEEEIYFRLRQLVGRNKERNT
ncbi:MAG: glycosyltransferase family 2 protein [Prevotella sp.]|nr:glycosyltransferase family 2 protein [Prevotellaceae bacterium]MDY3936004.1 glycosyltransferase family 2 protein [Prevotella sp.]